MVLDLLNISIEKNIQIYYLLAYLRNLAKLADQAIIEKIKDAWITRWETKMATLIHNAKWQNDQQVGGSHMQIKEGNSHMQSGKMINM